MPIDLAVLATTVVSSFLLPYIKLGAEKLVEGMGQKVGEDAAEHATGVTKQLWERVKTVFSSDEDKMVLAQFEKRPDASRTLVESILKEKLEHDGRLARDLAELVNATGPDGKSSGAQIMYAGIAGIADARGANFSDSSNVTITGLTLNNPHVLPHSGEEPNKDENIE